MQVKQLTAVVQLLQFLNKMIQTPTEKQKRKKVNIIIKLKNLTDSKAVITRWCDYESKEIINAISK